MSLPSVERSSDAIIIKLPVDASADYVQQALDYYAYVLGGVDSKISTDDINRLASEAKEGWWEANKHRFQDLDIEGDS